MAGYIGTKAALLSTTTASVGGDSTVGGDLTVDTNTLYVDSINNRVGIGNTSPTQALDVTGDIITSGGVYLGGTGSANYLDDYEEGTWTPTFVNAYLEGAYASLTGFTDVAGKYIKVGNKVTCWAEIRGFTGASGNLVGDDNFTFAGLPFVASQPSGWTVWDVLAGTVSIYQAVGVGENASGPIIAVTGGNVVAQVTAIANSVSSTSSYVMLNFTYITE